MNTEKTHTNKKILLYRLVQIIEELYPNRRTKNPYFEQFNEQLQGLEIDEQLLYHKLLHCYTLLNKQTRIYENSHTVASSKEDIINVFQFFKNDYQINAQKLYNFYNELEKTFRKEAFSKLEIQVRLRANKRFVERCLGQLQVYGLLKCVFRETAKQSKYQLQSNDYKIENQVQDYFAEAFEEWEDFKGFVEF